MRRVFLVTNLTLVSLAALVASTVISGRNQVEAGPDVFASPIHGGCYIAGPSDCRIHIDPFTINIATGQKLVEFQLWANPVGTGVRRLIYDFRPDVSNPPPGAGTTYTPSLVAQDFAATCGRTYYINMQGRDTGDANVLNMGQTGQFTCPENMP